MGLFDNYRTSVLYDYSIVSKATFYHFTHSSPNGKDVFTHKSTLPVQINPNELYLIQGVTKTYKLQNSVTTSTSGLIPNEHFDGGEVPKLDVPLKYDIYDEYNVATMDGAIPSTKLTLAGEESIVTIQKLCDIANGNVIQPGSSDNNFVLFKWGPLEFFGTLKQIEFRYTKFSRWGEPLAGDGTATISEAIFHEGTKVLKPSEFLSGTASTLAYEKISAETKISRAGSAALLASKAIR